VGEVGDAQRGLEIQAEYTAGDDKVHMCYSFEFLPAITPTPERVAEVMTELRTEPATAGPAGRFPTTTWCAMPPLEPRRDRAPAATRRC
jgi:hypothetical protein